ncbi:MAG: hypothetical protein ABJN69_17655 [Hellea sp.]
MSALILAAASLTLSACATKPERRGPPQDRAKSDRPAKSSGTFLQPISALFIGMDANDDKLVSNAEMEAATLAEWASFDRKPSASYFAQWSLKSLGSTDAMPTFMSFDRDFSGTITQSEFTTQLEQEFDRLDKNRDGSLQRSEMIVAFAAPQGNRSRKGKGEKGGKGGRGGGRPPR